MRRRILLLALPIILAGTVLGQTKNDPKGSRSLCNRESALDTIRQQIDSSKLLDDPVKRITVLIRAADTIWPYKEETGRAAKDSERDGGTAVKLLASADLLLSSDPNAAMIFARLSLRYPAAYQLPRFLYGLAETNQAAADEFYQEALTVYRDKPLSQLLYLSPYPFGNRQAAGDMPVTTTYLAPPTFKPNTSLQRSFIQTLLVRAQQAMAGKSDTTGFRGISEDGQIWLALTRLSPQLQELGPELIATVDRVRNELFAMLTQDAQKAVLSGARNQDPPRRTIDEQLGAVERERNSDTRDQLIVGMLFRSADTLELDKIRDYAAKISDSKLRQQVLNWIYFGRAQNLIKAKEFGEAKALAARVEELDQRAFLYADIATKSLDRIETQSQAREMLDEILDVAEKAPNSIVTARTLLTVAHLYTKIDVGRSISVMGNAIKSINRLENPDFSQQFLIRRIETNNFSSYASFQTPGLSPENVFRELGKFDFDSATLQAGSFLDKSLRASAMLAVTDVCLQDVQREEKKGSAKKRPGL